MSKIVLFLVNHDVVIYNFRLEIVKRLLGEGYKVVISSPYGPRIDDLIRLGCQYRDIRIDRHGINPIADIKLYLEYKKLIKELHPDIILTYTIKPNIYGSMAAAVLNIPYIVNITGLGTAVEQASIIQKGILFLYRYALRNVRRVFCQNTAILSFFEKYHLSNKLSLIPGSGVNLERFDVIPYPDAEHIEFAFISRIMKEKGIDLYLEAAKAIKAEYPDTVFHVCGFCEQDYEYILRDLDSRAIIIYHGMVQDVRNILEHVHCTVHPSYYPEGISNVLLESASSGRPVITTNRPGCEEVVDDGKTGYIVPVKEVKPLIGAMKRFIALDWDIKRKMGLAARKKMELEFDRQIVVNEYIKEIDSVADIASYLPSA